MCIVGWSTEKKNISSFFQGTSRDKPPPIEIEISDDDHDDERQPGDHLSSAEQPVAQTMASRSRDQHVSSAAQPALEMNALTDVKRWLSTLPQNFAQLEDLREAVHRLLTVKSLKGKKRSSWLIYVGATTSNKNERVEI